MAREIFIPEELQKPSAYSSFSKDQVSRSLSELGYGPSKKLVDSFYLYAHDLIGVGVLTVTHEHCLDHFQVFRGVDQVEAVAQTLILMYKFSGNLENNQRPLFKSIQGFEFDLPVVEGAVLNFLVRSIVSDEFKGEGQVLVGKEVIAGGIIQGAAITEEFVERYMERRRRIQTRTSPLFPPIN